MITNNDDLDWADGAEELSGVELTDKAGLIGVPFLVTAAWFENGNNDIQYAYLEGRRKDGTEFTINDSGTGIKAQIIEYLASRSATGELPIVDERVEIRLLIARGLRVSKYERKEGGKVKQAQTYYLSTNGKKGN